MAKSVYRDYAQQALDAEYNNREKVEDSADWISRYAIASAETRAALECRLDVAYGAHPGEMLDVFPARGAPAPVHVFVHGGYWQRLDKSDSSFVARALQPAGAAVVVINYALIPTVGMDELVRRIEETGGRVDKTVSIDTDFIVAIENAEQSDEFQKAVQFGVVIMREPELLEYLGR